jgi:hypothetical protein
VRPLHGHNLRIGGGGGSSYCGNLIYCGGSLGLAGAGAVIVTFAALRTAASCTLLRFFTITTTTTTTTTAATATATATVAVSPPYGEHRHGGGGAVDGREAQRAVDLRGELPAQLAAVGRRVDGQQPLRQLRHGLHAAAQVEIESKE